jgi:hypothetical protein
MDNHLYEFTRISLYRMCEHYLSKLKITLDGLNEQVLWKLEKEQLNSIGGIVLHIGEHIQRHVMRYSNSGKVEGGIDNYFPDENSLSSSELIQIITDRFNTWKEVMTDYLEGNMKQENLDMFDIYHLVEHTGYHLGQIIDRVQRLTDKRFQFVQNGINERSLKVLIYRD